MNGPVFIFPFSRNLSTSEKDELLNRFETFVSGWSAHGVPLSAGIRTEEDRFLLVSIDEEKAGASGCSKDKLHRFASETFGRMGLEEEKPGRFFVRSHEGKILALSRGQLMEMLDSGVLERGNSLFPTWLDSEEEREKFWGRPISEFSRVLRLD